MKTLWLLVRRTVQEYGADNCSHMAAAISYYVLFSVIPVTVFLVSIFGLVLRDEQLQVDVAGEIVDFLNIEAGDVIIEPDDAAIAERYGPEALAKVQAALDAPAFSQEEAQAIADALDAGQEVTIAGLRLGPDELSSRNDNAVMNAIRGVSRVSAPLSIVGLVGMAWSASAMFGAIRKSLNIAWDADARRPVVQQKALDLGMVLGLGLLLGLSIAGTAALRTLRELSDSALGPLSTGTGFFWSVLPLFLPAVMSFSVFMLLYRYVPSATSSFKTVWPGALLATALFEVLKNGFALYIAGFGSYDPVYGSLGGILLFMLWTYLTANILLIGAELAAEYPRVLSGEYAQTEAGPGDDRTFVAKALRAARGLFFHDSRDAGEPEPPGDAKAGG